MSFAYLFPSPLFQMLPSLDVNHRTSQLLEVKHDIVEVCNQMKTENAQLKADIADVRNDVEVIAARVEKLITSLEAKIDVVLAKPSENNEDGST